MERINVLKDNNIRFVSGGVSIEEARHGEVIPGILPLFEPVILDYIGLIKKKCDFLIVVFLAVKWLMSLFYQTHLAMIGRQQRETLV